MKSLWPLILGMVLCLAGCASQRQVVVGLSPDLEDYYAMYPSIEFDAVAVTSEEANQIKSDGVDKYFAPASSLRKRIDPFTVYFSQEHTQPETLPYRSNYWDRWLKKKPVTLVLIADLPHSPDMPEEDPRVLYIDLKKRDGLFTKPVYVEIEPQKITRIFDKPTDPRTHLPAANQKPDTQGTNPRVHGDAEKEK
ncbi:MAG: hypothetical protein LBU25_11300 [Treponema sp.]|nr:hypothetical protein [Treponema sp.]